MIFGQPENSEGQFSRLSENQMLQFPALRPPDFPTLRVFRLSDILE